MRAILPSASSRGVALVLVLAFLVLISVFILGFFSSVSTELKYSKTAANSATANQLADSAVSLAMSQIIEGTRGADPQNSSDLLAWASQPGMIRTYDASGSPKKYFKLYSSDSMVGAGTFDPTAANEVPSDWVSKPGEYVDLNAPVLTEDPNGLIQPDASRADKYSAVYPIVDPTAQGLVDGFGVTAPPGYSGSNPPAASFDPTQKSSGQSNNPAPMPVKWLYVLQDGTLKPASNTGASKTNPIVGRIAFWTDDETCKVNINTASEGVYWDIPRAFTREDAGSSIASSAGANAATPNLALCQPANEEFQRYPGHPATTSLSPVLAKLGNSPYLPSPVPSAANGYTDITASGVTKLDAYYKITPRVGLPASSGGGGGGSNGGTRRIPTTPLVPDADRLYASVDELMFKPTLDGGNQRISNTSSTSTPGVLTKGALEKARFFLTANSSGPETTLFNTPKVSIWPVWANASLRTAYDKLSAFCGTVGPSAGSNEYFFTRQNPRSPTQDYTARNRALYEYLQKMMGTAIPGFGGTFSAKYQADSDQILTSIYDYIRCTNLIDLTAGATPYTKTPVVWTHNSSSEFAEHAGSGEVIPIRIGNTQGFGRFNTVSELVLVFCGTQTGTTLINPADKNSVKLAKKMKAVVMMQFADPMQGNVGYEPNLFYKITGLDTIKIIPQDAAGNAIGGTIPLNLPVVASNLTLVADNQTHDGRSLGGIEGPGMAFASNHWNTPQDKRLNSPGGVSSRSQHNYPFFSPDITLPDGAVTFAIDSASIQPIKLEIVAADTATANTGMPDPNGVIQTLIFTIPTPATGNTAIRVPKAGEDFNSRLADFSSNPSKIYNIIKPEDTALGMEVAGTGGNGADTLLDPTAGDIRMIAGLNFVTDAHFRPHKGWTQTATGAAKTAFMNTHAHGLISSLGVYMEQGTGGKLVNNANYNNLRDPGVPSRVANGVKRADGGAGDWDTGTGMQKDGAYLNKADEGDQQFVDYVSGGQRLPYISKDDHFLTDGTVFSPNRQVASSMMFGSIPTGVKRFLPWQTLLFNPHPEDPSHPGKTSPPDHLLADFFWMPVVEPYAISQPLATNGKINMNYEIEPFSYIRRATGMYAVMKSTKFMALKASDTSWYKPHIWQDSFPSLPQNLKRRYSIDIDKTLAAFDTKFTNNEIFKSATQICEMNLVPVNGNPAVSSASDSAMAAFWNQNTLTGDNLREKPYVDLYPRLTTKSNTYTVHVCVQTLKKNSKTDPATFVDPDSTGGGPKDAVLSEYRGSSIIERYIDPNDPRLPDFATVFASNPTDPSLNIDQYYKFRVVSTKRFAP